MKKVNRFRQQQRQWPSGDISPVWRIGQNKILFLSAAAVSLPVQLFSPKQFDTQKLHFCFYTLDFLKVKNQYFFLSLLLSLVSDFNLNKVPNKFLLFSAIYIYTPRKYRCVQRYLSIPCQGRPSFKNFFVERVCELAWVDY